MDNQRLSTPWQHKALTKLMGLNYKITYKKGVDNKVVDALSRVSSTITYDISTLSVVKPLWLQDIQFSYTDPQFVKLLYELSVSSPQGFYTLQDGLIRYNDRIWVGSDLHLQTKNLAALHSSAIGVILVMKLHIRELNTFLLGPNSSSLSEIMWLSVLFASRQNLKGWLTQAC